MSLEEKMKVIEEHSITLLKNAVKYNARSKEMLVTIARNTPEFQVMGSSKINDIVNVAFNKMRKTLHVVSKKE